VEILECHVLMSLLSAYPLQEQVISWSARELRICAFYGIYRDTWAHSY